MTVYGTGVICEVGFVVSLSYLLLLITSSPTIDDADLFDGVLFFFYSGKANSFFSSDFFSSSLNDVLFSYDKLSFLRPISEWWFDFSLESSTLDSEALTSSVKSESSFLILPSDFSLTCLLCLLDWWLPISSLSS